MNLNGRQRRKTGYRDQEKFPLNVHEKLFMENAWFLYDHKDEILRDERMRQALIEMSNGLMYCDVKRFQCVPLCVYLQWWTECESSRYQTSAGQSALICQWGGSPLSGINTCHIVDRNGNIESVSIPYFAGCWRSFMEINKTAGNNTHSSSPYTLQEVISLLKVRREDMSNGKE